jgi:hypothetical protein
MKDRDSTVLYAYRTLLKLYPSAYRYEYEEEMLETMRAMLADSKGRTERWWLFWRACKDYVVSLTQQNITAYEVARITMPRYVKQYSLLSTGLVMPFFFICAYNSLNQYILKRSIPFGSIEAKTWNIYCTVLPLVAFGIVALGGFRSMRERKQKRHDSSGTAYDWVVLGVPLSLLFTIVLL